MYKQCEECTIEFKLLDIQNKVNSDLALPFKINVQER